MEQHVWACTATVEANWHPLTWISHMADVQLFGTNPRGHHVVSVVLHAFNVILLFFILRRATGYVTRSAVVAALFADTRNYPVLVVPRRGPIQGYSAASSPR